LAGSIDAILSGAFPQLPLPEPFFAATEGLDIDIRQELSTRVKGRVWTAVSLLDWRLVGASPSVCGRHMTPTSFAYYAPSLLLAAISEPAFLDWALEAILPPNQQRVPKGDWWLGYVEAFTDRQRLAIRSYLAHQRHTLSSSDVVGEELLNVADRLWA